MDSIYYTIYWLFAEKNTINKCYVKNIRDHQILDIVWIQLFVTQISSNRSLKYFMKKRRIKTFKESVINLWLCFFKLFVFSLK
jgi:hypothetical protein